MILTKQKDDLVRNLNVLYQSDDNYAVYMGVSICSLLENNRNIQTINLYIIDDKISQKNKIKLQDMVNSYSRNIFFLNGEAILAQKEITEIFYNTGMRNNKHSYLKLFVDKLIPELDERILYIDCDTAVTGDLSALITYNMQEKVIGMVMDSLLTKSKTAIGLCENEKYYNSGVILIDLKQWRQKECSKRLLEHIKNVRKYGTIDQDVLNVELRNEIVALPIEYNLQPIHLTYSYEKYSSVYKHKGEYYNKEEIEKAVAAPKIIHYLRYIGESPWHKDNVHPGTPFFDKYLSISPWSDYCKKAANVRWIFKVEKWMYCYLPRKIFLIIFYIVHDNMIKRSNMVKR